MGPQGQDPNLMESMLLDEQTQELALSSLFLLPYEHTVRRLVYTSEVALSTRSALQIWLLDSQSMSKQTSTA